MLGKANSRAIRAAGENSLTSDELRRFREILRDVLLPGRERKRMVNGEVQVEMVEHTPGETWPIDLALFVLDRDVATAPGHVVSITARGTRHMPDSPALAVERGDSSPLPKGRARPSRSRAREILLGLLEAIERASRDADAFKTLALILMVFRLDFAAGGDLTKAPTGRARVAWLAKRVEDATRRR